MIAAAPTAALAAKKKAAADPNANGKAFVKAWMSQPMEAWKASTAPASSKRKSKRTTFGGCAVAEGIFILHGRTCGETSAVWPFLFSSRRFHA
ncbi:MAG: hypothetical protein M5U33_08510 [Pseudorhodoplanes sp.]|nr:hypothetical protein [Pseudorhodoplanes sp.]